MRYKAIHELGNPLEVVVHNAGLAERTILEKPLVLAGGKRGGGRTKASSRVPLQAPAGLGAELDAIVRTKFANNGTKAAERAGLKQSHFAKLRYGHQRAITSETADLLRSFLRRYSRSIEPRLLDASAHLLLKYYSLWAAVAANRFAVDGTPLIAYAEGRPRVVGKVHEFDAIGSFLTRLLLEWNKAPYAGYLAPLRRAFRRWGNDSYNEARLGLSLVRIAGPLLDHYRSGFVERGWEELCNKEKTKFLKAGVVREIILLDRDPDIVRVSSVASKHFKDNWDVPFAALWSLTDDARTRTRHPRRKKQKRENLRRRTR